MDTKKIVNFAGQDAISDALTDLLKIGAQQLIATAVEAELESFLAQFSILRIEAGHAMVVRKGHYPARPLQTGIGPVSVRIPKIRSKSGKPVTFGSALVPLYLRKSGRTRVITRIASRFEQLTIGVSIVVGLNRTFGLRYRCPF
jgi:putative transposase